MSDEKRNPETEPETTEAEELEECGCEDGAEPQPEKPTRKPNPRKAETKPSTPAPAPPPPATPAPSARFMFPFNVRYAAEVLDLAGFVDGQEYTGAQVKEVLIQNGYTEFRDIEPDFHHNAATNTLVITIKGSKKGANHG